MSRIRGAKNRTVEKVIAIMLTLVLVVTLVPLGSASYANATDGDNAAVAAAGEASDSSATGQGQGQTEPENANTGSGGADADGENTGFTTDPAVTDQEQAETDTPDQAAAGSDSTNDQAATDGDLAPLDVTALGEGVLAPLAAEDWNDNGTDFTYKAGAVGNWTDLKAALDSIYGSYNADKPFIIVLSGTIAMTEAYAIDGKNIELRSQSGSNIDITTTGNFRHITSAATSKLVLVNITLNGGILPSDNYDYTKGGITVSGGDFTFNGNIKRCRAFRTFNNLQGNGAAILVSNSSSSLYVTGGILEENSTGTENGTGGAIAYYSNITVTSTVTISGNTQILNNAATSYGGGIAVQGQGSSNINLNISGSVKISGNSAGVCGGVFFDTSGTCTITDNVEISSNHALNVPKAGNLYPGVGGGVGVTNRNGAATGSTLTISGNVRIVNNTAARGGGGIILGLSNSTRPNVLNLLGGTISGNSANGDQRELLAGAPDVEKFSIGGGGGIYSFRPQEINIPSDSTVTFSGNYAPYAALTDVSNYAPWVPSENYKAHIFKSFGTSTSTGFSAPYDNLYNNYDIGAPNNVGHGIYSELTLVTSGSGQITQPDAQKNLYRDVFSDGRTWLELNQPNSFSFTATPQAGYAFTGWDYASVPALQDTEWDTAFGGSAATATATATIPAFTMPDVHVTLTANFVPVAHIADPSPLVFNADYSSGYTQPAAKALSLTNDGALAATGISVTLGSFQKDGANWTGAAPLAVSTTGATSIAAGATDTSWQIRPAAGLTQTGVYTAHATITYTDGAGNTQTAQTELAFALAQANQPAMVAIASYFDFGTALEGYSPIAAHPLVLQNFGQGAANITGIELVGTAKDAFTITPTPYTGTLAGRGAASYSEDTHWVLAPKDGLTEGVYLAELDVHYNGLVATEQLISFVVHKPAGLNTPNITFSNLEVGYSTPAYRPIEITNTGSTDATISSIVSATSPSNFSLSQGGSDFVGAQGTNNARLLAPKTGLAPGTYQETFTITYMAAGEATPKTSAFTVSLRVLDYLWLESTAVDGAANTQTSSTMTLRFAKPMKMDWANLTLSGAATKSGSGFTSVSGDLRTYVLAITPGTSAAEGDVINVLITLDGTKTFDASDPRSATYANYAALIAAALGGVGTIGDTAAVHVAIPEVAVTYSGNGGSPAVVTGGTTSAPYGSVLASAPPVPPTRTGYTFAGWYASATPAAGDAAWAFGGSGTALTLANGVTGSGTTYSLALYAKWTPKDVAVSWYRNYSGTDNTTLTAGTGTPVFDGTITSAMAPSAPSRLGYSFLGWGKTQDALLSDWTLGALGTGTALTVANGISGATGASPALSLFAVWQIKSNYTVTYSGLSGATPASIANKTGVSWTGTNLLPTGAAPTRAGYTFNGWYTAASGGTPVTNTDNYGALAGLDTTMSVTLYAQWTPRTVTVTYNQNGGSGLAGQATSGTYAGTLAAPTTQSSRTGYSFAGWYWDAGLMSAFVFGASGTGTVLDTAHGVADFSNPAAAGNAALTLYAKWTPNINNYTVNVAPASLGRGSVSTTGGNTASGTVAFNTTVNYAASANAGYHFDGWTVTGAGVLPAPSAATGSFAMPDNAVTLQANFAADTVTLAVNKNGAPFSAHGKTFKLSSTQPTLSDTNYTGTGTEATVTFSAVPDGTYYLFEGIIYTGVSFTKSGTSATATIDYYSLTVVAGTGGNTPLGSGDYYVGQLVPIDVSTSTGYTFDTWTRSSGVGTVTSSAKSGSFTMGSGVATVTASFTLNTSGYTVSANGAGSVTTGDVTASGNVSYNTQVKYLATPNAGYHFVNWGFNGIIITSPTTAGGSFNMPNEAVTLTATFAEDSNVTINYKPDAALHGSVSATSQSLAPATGTASAVTATPAAGYTFTNWTQDGAGVVSTNATFTPAKVGTLNVAASYTANFLPINYTVTYAVGATPTAGGTVPVDTKADYHVGDKVTIQANTGNLMRTGYTLAGWRADDTGTGSYWTAGSSTYVLGAGNVTFYPVWTANTYVVSFDAHGGSFISPTNYTVTFNSTYGALPNVFPAAPEKTGYNFNGWYTEATQGSGTKIEAGSVVTTAASHTLHAQYSPKDVSVSFNLNYPSAPTGPAAVSVKYDAVYTSSTPTWPTNPVRAGYTFVEWNLTSSGVGTPVGGASGATTTVQNESAHSVYARWTPNVVSLTVSLDGAGWSGHNKTFKLSSSSGSLSAIYYTGTTSGSAVSFEAIPNGTYYLFDGDVYANVSFVVLDDSPTPAVDYYTVSFAANSGSAPSPASAIYFSGQQFGAFPTVEKANWTLVAGGWWTDATTGMQLASTATVTATQTIYPHWTENAQYTVTYYASGSATPTPAPSGSAPVPLTQYVDSEVVVVGQASLQKTDYTFTGWTTDPAGTSTAGSGYDYYAATAIDGGSAKFTLTANTDLYAVWVENQVIQLDSQGGSSVPAFHIADSTEYVDAAGWPSTDPVRDGYSFSGWYSEVTGGTKIEAGIVYPTNISATTLFARWDAKAVAVTFYNNTSLTDNTTYAAGAVANAALKYDGKLSASTGEPQRDGYDFVAWRTERSSSSGIAYTLDSTIVSKDNGVIDALSAPKLALYAQWTPKSDTQYKVEFYYQPSEGAPYGAATSTLNRAGVTEAVVEVTDADKIPSSLALYMLDDVATNKVYSGAVKGDGTTTLRVYFKYRFTPVKDSHYSTTSLSTAAPVGWTKDDFVLTAKDGYALSVTEGGPWETNITLTDETSLGSTGFFVKRIGASVGGIYQNEISQQKTETYKIDKTVPTAKIEYKSNGLREFLNAVTFGLFFKDTTDVSIVGADSGTAPSGVASVDYYLTTSTYADAAAAFVAASAFSWTNVAGTVASFIIDPADKGKYHIFARVTDSAGNQSIYLDSAVIYTDAGASGGSGTYYRASAPGTTVSYTLANGGNTLAELRNTTAGGSGVLLSEGSDYVYTATSNETGTVTLTNAYLSTLQASATPYTFTVSYKPQGTPFVSGAINDTPGVTGFSLTVGKSSQTPLDITGLSYSYVYGDSDVTNIGTTGGSGAGDVSYTLTPASGPASVTANDQAGTTATLEILAPGTFTLSATKVADADYNLASATSVAVTVNKAVPGVSVAGSGGASFGQDVIITATLAKVGKGAMPGGTVDFYVDGQPVAQGVWLTGGQATYNAGALSGGDHSLEVRYNGNNFYKGFGAVDNDDTTSTGARSAPLTYTVGKAADAIIIAPVTGKLYGDTAFTMTLADAGSGMGAVTWSSSDTTIASIDPASGLVTITGVGSTTITASKATDTNYNAASATYLLSVDKATPVWATIPFGTQVTYGQTLSTSALSGGQVQGYGVYGSDTLVGTLSWTAPATIPDVSGINAATDFYSVTWTPSGVYAAHYNSIATTLATLPVIKAQPMLATPLNSTPIEFNTPLSGANITGGNVTYLRGGVATPVAASADATRSNGWVWNDGSQQYSYCGNYTAAANFLPLDTARFNTIASAPVDVIVFSPQTKITVAPIASGITYGDLVGISALDTNAAIAIAVGEFGDPPISGSWTWSTPSALANATGTIYSEVTFTPDNLTTTPDVAFSGYVRSTVNVPIEVAQATPVLDIVQASGILNGQTLSASMISPNFAFSGVFGEPVSGTIIWPTDSVVPSETLAGGVGTYTAEAVFTPNGGFEANYKPVKVSIPVDVRANKSALIDFEDTVEALLGAVAVDIHEENYRAEDVSALREAIGAANVVLASFDVTQDAVDEALAVLEAAYGALAHYHPVLEHSHPNGVTAFGEQVTVRIKGQMSDATMLSLSGVVYTFGETAPTGERAILRDGSEVGRLTSGSAVVSFSAAEIDSLANGTYPLVVTFVDNLGVGRSTGSNVADSAVIVNRTVANDVVTAGTPQTGDNPTPWLLAVWLAAAGVLTLMVRYLMILRRRGIQ